jgi:hypothetical protein
MQFSGFIKKLIEANGLQLVGDADLQPVPNPVRRADGIPRAIARARQADIDADAFFVKFDDIDQTDVFRAADQDTIHSGLGWCGATRLRPGGRRY